MVKRWEAKVNSMQKVVFQAIPVMCYDSYGREGIQFYMEVHIPLAR